MSKRIVFTTHALKRMSGPRGPVSREDVLAVLQNPAVTYIGEDGKPNALGEASGKRLRICYIEDDRRILVVTVINRGT